MPIVAEKWSENVFIYYGYDNKWLSLSFMKLYFYFLFFFYFFFEIQFKVCVGPQERLEREERVIIDLVYQHISQ